MKNNILSVPFTFASLFFALFFWSGCGDGCASTKENFMKEYYTLIDEVKRTPPTGDGWAKTDEQFRKYIRVCFPKFKDKMSVVEQTQFWWSGLNYFYARYGKNMVNMVTNDDLLKEVKDNITALGKNFDETVAQISEGWDSIVKGIQDRWTDIKNLFN